MARPTGQKIKKTIFEVTSKRSGKPYQYPMSVGFDEASLMIWHNMLFQRGEITSSNEFDEFEMVQKRFRHLADDFINACSSDAGTSNDKELSDTVSHLQTMFSRAAYSFPRYTLDMNEVPRILSKQLRFSLISETKIAEIVDLTRINNDLGIATFKDNLNPRCSDKVFLFNLSLLCIVQKLHPDRFTYPIFSDYSTYNADPSSDDSSNRPKLRDSIDKLLTGVDGSIDGNTDALINLHKFLYQDVYNTDPNIFSRCYSEELKDYCYAYKSLSSLQHADELKVIGKYYSEKSSGHVSSTSGSQDPMAECISTLKKDLKRTTEKLLDLFYDNIGFINNNIEYEDNQWEYHMYLQEIDEDIEDIEKWLSSNEGGLTKLFSKEAFYSFMPLLIKIPDVTKLTDTLFNIYNSEEEDFDEFSRMIFYRHGQKKVLSNEPHEEYSKKKMSDWLVDAKRKGDIKEFALLLSCFYAEENKSVNEAAISFILSLTATASENPDWFTSFSSIIRDYCQDKYKTWNEFVKEQQQSVN